MPRPRRRPPVRSLSALLALILLTWLAQQSGFAPGDARVQPDRQGGREATTTVETRSSEPADDDTGRIARAFAERESGFMVSLEGEVEKLLPDDRDGSRHQRFLVRLAEGPTLLVAHNIDLADRAPVERGDLVRIRGQYEWNEKGGVLHWTHHSPGGDHPDGWIEVDGRRIE